jgi:uncharacterized membrane protein YcaP (DUF421 family)
MPPCASPLLWADGIWVSMFHLGPPVLEKVARPIIVYVFLVILLRIFGKRELAQLNPFDLVVLLCLSNTVQNAIIGEDNSVTGGLIGALSLCAINYIVIRFLFRHRRLDQIIQGRPTVLIKGGRLQRQAMARELINRSELLMIAHRQGFASLEEIDCCTLEPGGTFVVEGKEPRQAERHQAELIERIEQLSRRIEELTNRLGPEPSSPPGEAVSA